MSRPNICMMPTWRPAAAVACARLCARWKIASPWSPKPLSPTTPVSTRCGNRTRRATRGGCRRRSPRRKRANIVAMASIIEASTPMKSQRCKRRRTPSMRADTLVIPQETEALISGCEAIAQACKLADVDVITGYPIRPYDTVMQAIAKLISNGEFDAEYIIAESEHSQFEIVKHASAVGARVFVGSSGVGWMYAMEALTVTPPLRIPMVAMVGNRALDDPGAFGVEHNDALAVRDLGWMLVWVDTAQEALDTALIAWRVAEDPRVFLPFAGSCDGSFLTHSQAIVRVPTSQQVERYLPPYDR